MAREDWQERDAERRREMRRDRDDDFGQADYSDAYGYDRDRRTGYRLDEDHRARFDDYGQADYSTDFVYDARGRRAHRRYDEVHPREPIEDDGRPREERSWMDRAGDFFTGHPHQRPRRGPSDRVLWAVIVERLEDERLDLRDVEVIVEDREVTLNGAVRRKGDKRRIEDVADIDGVRHVQNNLRVRAHGRLHWTFL
jgi:hypothetical protein